MHTPKVDKKIAKKRQVLCITRAQKWRNQRPKTMNTTIYIYMRKHQSNHNLGDYYCNVIDMTPDPLKVQTAMKIFAP